MKKILLSTLLLGSVMAANAINYQFSDLNATNHTCTLVGWIGTAPTGKLILPESFSDATGTYAVTCIADGALDNLTEVTEIQISKDVTRIGNATASMLGEARNFRNCPKLEKFSIDDGNNSFSTMADGVLVTAGSKYLIKVPQMVATTNGTFKLSTSIIGIFRNAFAENSSITDLYLSPNITDFNEYPGFNDMKSLKFFAINGTVSPKNYTIEYGVLYNKEKTTLISHPPYKQIESFSVPNTVTTIAEGALANTIYLYQANAYSVTSYGKRAYAGSGITSASISSKVKSIGEAMFKGCKRLSKIEFHRDLDIPISFAEDCPVLTEVTGTSMIVNIDKFAFKNCPKLASFPFTAHSKYTGKGIFDGDGFENVVFASSNYDGDFGYMGDNFLANNKNLKVVDLSAVKVATRDDAFDWGVGMVWGCPEITTVKFPPLTTFWYDPNNLRPVFEPNCPIEHIEISAFFPGHAPLFTFTTGEHYPNIFVKTTDALTSCCPLNKLISRDGSSVVRANVYCEAYTMVSNEPYNNPEEYVIADSDYYVPGNTLQNYQAVSKAGCRLYESYLFYSVDTNGKYSVMLMPLESRLLFTDVLINGKSAGVPDASGMLHTDIPYNQVENIRVNYTIRDVPMTTYYPSKENFSSVAELQYNLLQQSPAYDLNGRRINTDTYKGIKVSAAGKQLSR